MFKRIMYVTTFLAAFGLVSVLTPDSAEARRWGRWSRPWGGYYGSYYRPPRVYYRAPVYPPYYRYYGGPRTYVGYPPYYGYGPRRGMYFSWGY